MPTAWSAESNPPGQAPPAQAEIGLEQLMKMEIPTVEAASKYAQKITEAPSSVTIVTADEIKRYGHRTLADVLRTVQGVYVTEGRNYSFLGVRGFNQGIYNSRVLVLVDGHRINNNLSDGAFVGTQFLLDVDLIDKVEVIRGPSAVLYGNNAFFGVINVVTRKGRSLPGSGAEISGAYASFDASQGRATYGHQFKNSLEMLLSGTFYDSEGRNRLFFPEYNSPANNNGIAEKADRGKYRNFFGDLSWYDFTVEGGFLDRQKNDPTNPYFYNTPTFDDPRARTSDQRGYINLKFAHSFPEVADVTANVYYDRYDLAIDYPLGPLFREQQIGEWWGAEVQVNKQLWDRLTLTVGAEYRDDFRQHDGVFDADTGVSPGPPSDRATGNHGVFAQGDFGIRTNLHLNAGGRYDQYGKFDPSFNPRLALIYDPFEKTTLKAIYGSAFRAPNFFEQVSAALINTRFSPETIHTYELVYEQGIGDHLRSSVSGFYNEIQNLIASSVDPATLNPEFRNVPKVQSKGLEMALQSSSSGGVIARVSYTLEQAEDRGTGQKLSDSPSHLAKLNLSVPLLKDKIFAGFEVQYTSQRTVGPHHLPNLTVPPPPLTFIPAAGSEVGDFAVVNFTLYAQNLAKGLETSFSIYNLLDRHYRDPANPIVHALNFLEQDGRSFRVKLTYKF